MSNLPVVALVGRPNVGKSTLFNQLTRSRDALVADHPGLTRDRQYGRIRRGDLQALVVDTGGIAADPEGVTEAALKQVRVALEEADVIAFLVDARDGLAPQDEEIAAMLRRLDKPVLLVVNKIDGVRGNPEHDFYRLGLGEPLAIAAAHGMHLDALVAALQHRLPGPEAPADEANEGIRIAVVGRPNVGKSTLVNRVLGEERVVVYDQPGTTRDSIQVPFERDGRRYVLIDTAGIRRRARIHQLIEKFSVIKALQAIEQAQVVLYLIDAHEGVTDQDAHLLGKVLEVGRALIVCLNKWDGLKPDQREQVRSQIELKLPFLDFAAKRYISALHGTGVGNLFDDIPRMVEAASREFSSSHLTDLLHEAQLVHQPPLVKGRRIKLKYAHQGGQNPPVIVIHGNQTEDTPDSYRRYLMHFYRERLGLEGVPLRLVFRTGDNPFAGRRNPLSERQVRKRRRLMDFVKRR